MWNLNEVKSQNSKVKRKKEEGRRKKEQIKSQKSKIQKHANPETSFFRGNIMSG
ncbi:MAG: hypothetical protein F6K17_01690 [Okeania sp. SIO3C4]|nr:hypothetical protein [Okeania sp. SIO3B3]NER01427.1 hypothetical protein [Okeania sp. SIO3C4]